MKTSKDENMKTTMTDKEKMKEIKTQESIRATNFGENKDEIKLDAKNELRHIPYDQKKDLRNAKNTVVSR